VAGLRAPADGRAEGPAVARLTDALGKSNPSGLVTQRDNCLVGAVFQPDLDPTSS
jgi:hypothetical protein